MSLSILLTPDNNLVYFRRCLYHISRFTKTLLEKNEKFELVVIDDGSFDIYPEVEAFGINFFWKIVRPHYNSLEKVGIDKLYKFPNYSERLAFDNCAYDKIIKISANVIPVQDSLQKLYLSEVLNGWNLSNVFGIDPSIEDRIDTYGIFFPKNVKELSDPNPIQTDLYIKYKRPVFGITKKEFYWSDDFNVLYDAYALSFMQDDSLFKNDGVEDSKLIDLKENIEIITNIL